MPSQPRAIEIPNLRLAPPTASTHGGSQTLAAILDLATASMAGLRAAAETHGLASIAAVGRLRGTGRGVHFRDLVAAIERDMPIEMSAPFEGSDLVAGAAWPEIDIAGTGQRAALAKLRWSAGADDLPMHIHEHSDRFIIVHEGRGFFHVSNQSIAQFDGGDVQSIPARERDVFIFTRGVVHTFSTADEPMTLLSCQLPFLPFDDPQQYRLPSMRWVAREHPEPRPAQVACDPAWTVLAQLQDSDDRSKPWWKNQDVPPLV